MKVNLLDSPDGDKSTITFTPQKLYQLKVGIEMAQKLGIDVFTFEGHELNVKFAAYLAEYLETQFK